MFKFARILAVAGLALSTAACVSTDRASQNAITETPVPGATAVTTTTIAPGEISEATFTAAATPAFDVTAVEVIVPDYLVVSEADVFIPQADIVWREDPRGDRKAQVKEIMTNALKAGTADMHGGRKVILAARLNTFHALTEKARATVGGKHNINFDYVLLDAETGQPLTQAKQVDASLRGYGGRKAYRAMRRGETQKFRISEHVAEVIRSELTGI